MDSFSLYCLATEIDQTRMPQVLGLIEARLVADPRRVDDWLYKGALLARIGAGLDDRRRRQRFVTTGVDMMDRTRPVRWGRGGGLAELKLIYARSLTMAVLPRPLIAPAKARDAMAELLGHPGFRHLHPCRRAHALETRARVPYLPEGSAPVRRAWAR